MRSSMEVEWLAVHHFVKSGLHSSTLDRKEETVLFNHALNMFYFQLYGNGHMIKCHSDSEKGNLLPRNSLMGWVHHEGWIR